MPHKVCPQCGNDFYNPSSKVVCCSTACSYAMRHKRDIRKCVHCGTEFEINSKSPKKFCSKTCRGAFDSNPSNKVTKLCKHCGEAFTSWAYRNQQYCSRECKKFCDWKGGKDRRERRGHNWDKQRRATIKRDGNTCQICGVKYSPKTKGLIDVHHIIPYRDFKGDFKAANQLSNLITLCRKCHRLVEDGKLACPVRLL